MNEIDNRVVEMQFDNKQFEEGVKTSLSTIERLKQALKFEKTGEGLKELGRTTQSFSMDHIAKDLDTISSRFTTLGIIGTRVLQNLTDTAMRFAHKAVNAITQPIIHGGIERAMDISQAKFMVEGLGQVWEDVYASANKAVSGTAYGFNEAAKAAAQLGASGVQAGQEMTNILTGIAGTAAMTGASFADISDIFTTVAGQGKLMAYQMNQLSFRGLNAAATLGQVLNKSEAEIRDMVSKGQISFEMFSDAMFKAFGEHAHDADKTFTGSLANMKAALKRIGQEVALPSLDHLRDLFNAIKPKIDEVHKALGSSSEGFLGDVVKGIDVVTHGLANFISNLDLSWVKGTAETASNVFKGLGGIILRTKDELVKLVPDDLGKKFTEIGKTLKEWSASFKDKFAYKGLTESLEKVEQKSEEVSQKLYSVTKLAKQVINGDFGNGEKRVKELHNIGASYAKVQNKVNDLLGSSIRHKETQEDLAAEEKLRVKLQKQMAESTDKVAEKAVESDNNYTRLAKTFAGLFSVVKMAGSAFSALYSVILKPAAITLANGILTISSKIGEKLVDLYQYTKKNNTFESSLKAIKKQLLIIPNAITKIVKTIQPFKLLTSTFTLMATGIKTVATGIISLKDRLVSFGNTLKDMPGVTHLMDSLGRLGESLRSLALGAIEKVSSLFGALGSTKLDFGGFDALPQILDFVADKLATVLDLLMKGAGYAKDFLSSLGGNASNSVGAVSDSIGKLSDKVKDVQNKSEKFTGALGSFFKRLGENAKGVYDHSKSAAENLAKGLVDGFKGINFDKVLNWAKLGAHIYLIFKLVDLIKSMQGSVDAISSIPKKIAGVFGALSDAITTYKDSLKSSMIDSISTAIFKIASAMLILSGIPTKQLDAITADIALLMLGIGAIMKAMSSVTAVSQNADIAGVAANIKNFLTAFISTFKMAANFIGVATLFVGFAAAVGILVKTFLDLFVGLEEISKHAGRAAAALGILTAFGVGLTAVAIILSKAAFSLGAGTGVALVGLAASIAILAGVMKVVGTFKPEEAKQGTLAILALMVGIGAMAKLSSSGNSLISAAAGMMVMSLAIAALVPSLWLIAKLPADGISNALLAIVVAFGGLAALSAVSSKFNLDFTKTAGSLLMFGGALLTMAAAMRLFAPVADKTVPALIALGGTLAVMAVGALITEKLGMAMAEFAGILLATSVSFLAFGAAALLFGMGVEAMGKGLSLIGQGFIDLVNGILEAGKTVSENKEQFAQGIADTITATADGIHRGRPGIVQATADFLTGIAEGLVKSTPEILNAITTFSTALLMSFVHGIGTLIDIACIALVLGINELAQTIVDNSDALCEAVQNVMLAVLYVAANGIQRVIDGLLGPLLDTFFPGARDAWDSGWEQVKQHIENSMSYEEGNKLTSRYFQGANDGVQNGSAPFVTAVGDAVDAADAKAKEIAQTQIPGSINDPFNKEFNAAAETANQGGNTIYNNLSHSLGDGKFHQLGSDKINELMEGLRTGDFSMLEEMGYHIPEGLANSIQAGAPISEEAMAALAKGDMETFTSLLGISSPSTVFMGYGANIIEGLAQGLSNNLGKALAPITQLATKLSGSMKGKGSGFTAAGKSMMKALSSAIKAGAPASTKNVTTAIKNCVTAIKSKASSFKTQGTTLMKNLASGLKSLASKVKDNVKDAVSRARSAAADYKNRFYSVGSDLMSGLRSGIMSKVGQIASAAANAVARAIAAARAKAKSHSPSKEFMWIGEDFGEGMIIGIRNMSRAVRLASETMTGFSIDSAKSAMDSIADLLGMGDNNPVITPVVDMSGVYASSRDIDRIFGSQSFGVNTNLDAVNRMLSNRQNGNDNSDIISALDKLGRGIKEMPRNSTYVNGITYDDGSAISDAVQSLVRAARIEGRR